MAPQVYINDTNIWIDFCNAGLLNALFDLPFQLCSTDFVLSELQDFDPAALLAKGLVVRGLDENSTARLFGLMAAHNNSSLADVPATCWRKKLATLCSLAMAACANKPHKTDCGGLWCLVAAGPLVGTPSDHTQCCYRRTQERAASRCATAACGVPCALKRLAGLNFYSGNPTDLAAARTASHADCAPPSV